MVIRPSAVLIPANPYGADLRPEWDRVLDPHPEGLQAAATIIRANAARKAVTFVNVNNHFEGSAPTSIGRLLEVLAKEGSG